jgi:hypothetical protein
MYLRKKRKYLRYLSFTSAYFGQDNKCLRDFVVY